MRGPFDIYDSNCSAQRKKGNAYNMNAAIYDTVSNGSIIDNDNTKFLVSAVIH